MPASPSKRGQRRHRQAHGVAGAALLGLLDDLDGAGAEARQQHRLDRLVLVPEHGDHRIGAHARAPARRDSVTSGWPSSSCRTFARDERMRVPLPAASTIAASGPPPRLPAPFLRPVPFLRLRVAVAMDRRLLTTRCRNVHHGPPRGSHALSVAARLPRANGGLRPDRRERCRAAAADRRGAEARPGSTWPRRPRPPGRRRASARACPTSSSSTPSWRTATASRWPTSCAAPRRRARPRSCSSPARTAAPAIAPRRAAGSPRPTT